MTDSRLDQKRLDELRGYVTRLSLLQAQLRKSLEQYADRTGDSSNTVAKKIGSNWATVAGLQEGERVVLKDTIVRNLARLIGVSDEVAGEIITLGKKVPPRYLGLAAFGQEVIDIVFDLLVAHTTVFQAYSMAEFAKAFAQCEQPVFGALNLLREALVALQSTSGLIDEILEILLDEVLLERKLKEAKEAQNQRRLAAIAEIDRRVAGLMPGYDDKVSLVKDLGLAQGSLDRAKLIGASDAQIDRLLSILQTAARKDEQPGRKTRTEPSRETSRVAGAAPVESSEESLADPFRGLAGSTIQDVPHVLTADNFREIEGLSAEAVINALVVSMQTTTGLLALVAQMKGGEIRRLMQQPRIARLRRALYDAQEVAATTDPTPLLKMFDQQRAMWGSMTDSAKTEKGGVTHG